MPKIILIDNHDSFTGNLFQLFDENQNCSIEVVSVSDVKLEDLDYFDKIVLSPGPDVPTAYPKLFEILDAYSKTKSILGVCLGHQTLVEFFGGKLLNLPQVFHGKQETVEVDLDDELFRNLNHQIQVGLYHSWAADESFLPKCFNITARSSKNIIMAVSHKSLDCKGVQFHPESFMSPKGRVIIDNWIG